MTATQVVNRFLKDNGIYSIIKPCILELYKKYKYVKAYENCAKKIIEQHGAKKTYVDFILKCNRYSLLDFFYLLWTSRKFMDLNQSKAINAGKLVSLYRSFIIANIKCNYKKIYLSDLKPEMLRDSFGRYRNGYHVLDYSWKWE